MNPLFLLAQQAAAPQEAPGVWTYFIESNFAGQVIVLVLVVFSLIAWTLMIGKYLDLKVMQQQNESFEALLARESLVLNLDAMAIAKLRGPYALLTREAVQAYYRGREISVEVDTRIGASENALARGVGQVVIRYEAKMVFLATIVAGAPLLGLLGTVWGVMDSFGGIAYSAAGATATIQTLAPGVAGALLTTVAGLCVAIPSAFGYNYLLAQTKIMMTEIENFASDLADRLRLEAHDSVNKALSQRKS